MIWMFSHRIPLNEDVENYSNCHRARLPNDILHDLSFYRSKDNRRVDFFLSLSIS